MTSTEPLLSVQNLRTQIATENGIVTAVDGVSFDLHRDEVLAIVGESGCGKSMTALSILGLIPPRVSEITNGRVMFNGEDLTKVSKQRIRQVRGAEIAMIFQDALTGLNPVYRVGDQIVEMIRAHERISKRDAHKRAVELLGLVGIPKPELRAQQYVHEFSGGMRQRAMIAMAIALEPQVLIADEPTTALDVTVQAQVMEVMLEIKERINSSIILITHDLGLVAGAADRVLVMYAGRQIEEGRIDQLYAQPQHPYTHGLLNAMPRVDDTNNRLVQIAGAPPSLITPPPGCRFEPRCTFATDVCRAEYPEYQKSDAATHVACHHASQPNWQQTLRGQAANT
jgi:oligopeptide/dipeptide ABC transporter ATP-binding protein